jgi:hypothetical protein
MCKRLALGNTQDMKSRGPDMTVRAFPVGICYCGCGTRLEDPKAFFVQGHDKRAEGRVIREKYGNVPNFLIAHGYGPAQRGPEEN